MGAIQGIKARIVVGSAVGDGSTNRLFLGVHDTSSPQNSGAGGREFPLWAESAGNLAPGSNTTFAVGSPCCPDPKQVQVYDSGNSGGVNHPSHNPIELNSVDFVYLRKAASTTVDDSLIVQDAEVLLCDGSLSGLRRFRSNGTLNFGQSWGEQHWLREVPPPRCRISVSLKDVEQWGTGTNGSPAGRNWNLWLNASVAGQSSSTPISHFQASISGRKHWHEVFNTSMEFEVPGCCGATHNISLTGLATEHDLGNSTDSGQGSIILKMPCTDTASTQNAQITFDVQGNLHMRRSKLTFNVDVTAVCIS